MSSWYDRFKNQENTQNSALATKGNTSIQTTPSPARKTEIHFLNGSDASVKSGPFSQMAMDFVNAASVIPRQYTENQLLSAYMSSVYMFAALKRIANLMSRAKIVAEVKEEDQWVRAPETVLINRIFEREGSLLLPRMWLNYAVYGSSVVFKTKTRRAILEEERGEPIYDYSKGAVAGLYCLDKPLWELDEDISWGEIRGAHVFQNSDVVGDKSYLKREEFVYVTDWNPLNPNRGQSIVSHTIHEAVANASIAQWMSEYFTRGAMPMIMVTLTDTDPNMLTDADLRRLKRQFEEHWQGVDSSLRSVFLDRQVQIEQVGIPASEIGAPELNEAALAAIASAVGIDRELIVTPQGGSQARHEELVQRAWEDAVIPRLKEFLVAFNRDLGLPEGMRLVLDLSEISELEADREQKSSTEISIFDSGLQTYGEARHRMKMQPIEPLENWVTYDGKLIPLSQVEKVAVMPPTSLVEYITGLWDANLLRKSEAREMLGMKLGKKERDGYKYDLENGDDFLTGLWQEDLLTRQQVLSMMDLPLPKGMKDGYRSELERGAEYADFVRGLWSDNLITRVQAVQLLELNLEPVPNMRDGFSDEIGETTSLARDLWSSNLITRDQALAMLGIESRTDVDGYSDEITQLTESEFSKRDKMQQLIFDMWGENMLKRSEVLRLLGSTLTTGEIDGYKNEVDALMEHQVEKQIESDTPADQVDDGEDDSNFWSNPTNNGTDDDPNNTPPSGGGTPKLPSGDSGNTTTPAVPDIQQSVQQEQKKPVITNPSTVGSQETKDAETAVVQSVNTTPKLDNLLAKNDTLSAFDSVTIRNIQQEMLKSISENIAIEGAEETYFNNLGSVAPHDGQYGDEVDVLDKVPTDVNYQETFDGSSNVNDIPTMAIEDAEKSIDVTKQEPNFYTIFKIKATPDLQMYIKDLQAINPSSEIKWTEPSDLHVTLGAFNVGSDVDIEKAKQFLPLSYPKVPIEYDTLTTFNNEDATVYILQVKNQSDVVLHRQPINRAFTNVGALHVEYEAGVYRPHITIAYVPKNVMFNPLETSGVTYTTELMCNFDDQNPLIEIVCRDNAGTPVVVNNDNATDFEPLVTNEPDLNINIVEKIRWWLDYKRNKMQSQLSLYIEKLKNNEAVTFEFNNVGLTTALTNALHYFGVNEVFDAANICINDGLFDEDNEHLFENGETEILPQLFSDYYENPIIKQIELPLLPAIVDELKTWKKYTLKHGVTKSVGFNTQSVSRYIAESIKSGLRSSQGSFKTDTNEYYNSVKSTFDTIIEAYETKPQTKSHVTKGTLDGWVKRIVDTKDETLMSMLYADKSDK